MNAVTCLTWIRRGVAKARPDKVQLNDEDLSNLIKSSAKSRVDDSDDEQDGKDDILGASSSSANDNNGEMDTLESKYNLDHYDDDEENDDMDNGLLSMAGLSFFDSNKQDPYLPKDQESDADSDEMIKPDDDLIALGKVHGDYFSLEIWVNNASDGSLYCHHDSVLSNCPLAIEWIGFDSGDENPLSGNLVAVGSLASDIELWDVDVVNTIEPAFVLKGERKKKSKNVKDSKKAKRSLGHSDSVLSLSWNRNRQSILASASADGSVGVWDLMSGTVVSFFRSHGDKVQTVQWHPVEDQLVLSGSYDGCVRLFDCRAPPGDPSRSWSLGGEIEKVMWNHHEPFCAFAGTDSGLLACIDVRNSDPRYTFAAHTSALTGLALSPSIASCLATGSNDRSFKVWDISVASENSTPLLVSERSCKIGAIHCASSCPDEPMVVCIGGDREMKVINLQKDSKFMSRFESHVKTVAGAVDSVATDRCAPSDDSLPACSDVGLQVVEGVTVFTANAEKSQKKKKKKKHSKVKKI